MTDKNWFDDKNILLDFNYAISEIIARDQVKGMSVSDLFVLRNSLRKIVDLAVEDKVNRKLRLSDELKNMTDQQVEEYLLEKYSVLWPALHLNCEEFDRIQTPYFQDKIQNFK